MVVLAGEFRTEGNAVFRVVDIGTAAYCNGIALFTRNVLLNFKKGLYKAAFRRNVVGFGLHIRRNGDSAS